MQYNAGRLYKRSERFIFVSFYARYYKAPEHLFGYRVYTPATDVWSLGTIFCRLLLGYPIFAGESDLEQIGFIVRRLGRPPASVIKEAST